MICFVLSSIGDELHFVRFKAKSEKSVAVDTDVQGILAKELRIIPGTMLAMLLA
jgi:hypothetical protein